MTISIGTKHRITSDNMNIILQVKQKSKLGKIRWKSDAYFSNAKSLLKYLADERLRDTGFISIKTIAKRQDEIYILIDGLNIAEKL